MAVGARGRAQSQSVSVCVRKTTFAIEADRPRVIELYKRQVSSPCDCGVRTGVRECACEACM